MDNLLPSTSKTMQPLSFSDMLKKKKIETKELKDEENKSKSKRKSVQSIDKIELNTLSPMSNDTPQFKNNFDLWVQIYYDDIYNLFVKLKTMTENLCPNILRECSFDHFAELLFNFSTIKLNDYSSSDEGLNENDLSDDEVT